MTLQQLEPLLLKEHTIADEGRNTSKQMEFLPAFFPADPRIFT